MFPTDDSLLDFDADRLDDYSPEKAVELLNEQPDLYRNHLLVARFLARWADGLEEGDGRPDTDNTDFCQALREVIAHLRQGDLVPGGVLYEAEMMDPDPS